MMLIFIFLMMVGNGYGQGTLSADVITNTKTNTFTVKSKVITDYSSSKVEAWRFVHDGKSLIGEPFFTGSMTYTPYKIVECKTFALATNEIIKLNLKLTDQQTNDIDRLAQELSGKEDNK